MDVDAKWIFSLSLDDDNWRWGATRIDGKGNLLPDEKKGDTRTGILLKPPRNTKGVDLQEIIRKRLSDLKQSEPDIFDSAVGAGVSTVGVVDREKNRLINTRQQWKRQKSKDDIIAYIVDFEKLLKEFFNPNIKISVHNNTTAKCLSEFERLRQISGPNDELPGVLFYATFQEGINGAFISAQPNSVFPCKPLAPTLHQELGHIFTPFHYHDTKFERKYSGCPVHEKCFIGIAGSQRIQKQWGAKLYDLKLHEDRPWQLMAYYVAQFCWNAVLTIPPAKILLGGNTIFPELLPLIRAEFTIINSYLGDRYINYKQLIDDNFISFGNLPFPTAGVLGGFELARMPFREFTPVLHLA